MCLDREPDAILAFRLGSMAPLLRLARPLPPIFFDLDDAEHVKAMRSVRDRPGLVHHARAYASVPILWWSEHRAMALARSTFLTSRSDLVRFRRFPRHSHRVVIPNAVTVPSLQSPTLESTMLFVGTYIYRPNVEAAEYLIRDIWPRVRRVAPDSRLLIVGAEPDRIPSYAEAPPGVEFLGFVDDMSTVYQRTRLVCCPIRVAAGTRFKILEAAAYAKPVVSSTVGAEGIDLRDGEAILLRDDPSSFAAACLQVLRNPPLGERMGRAARTVIRERYERDIVIDKIRKVVSASLAIR